jgi:hypothetical protein
MHVVHRTLTGASGAVGSALAGAVAGVAAIRTARKPLHPRGQVITARLHRRGTDPTTGVPWLDEAGDDDVLVRLSRAVGLPLWLPDIEGLALRTDPHGHPGDLLFATTGGGRLSRFVLFPSRRPDRPMTTLLPYRTPVGPVVLGARRTGSSRFELAYAVGLGRWTAFAELVLPALVPTRVPPTDPEISFDPLLNRIPGLEPYEWVRRLRAPGYARARQERSGTGP